MKFTSIIPAVFLCLTATASELPPSMMAKFVKIVVSSAGGAVACKDSELAKELAMAGVKVEGSAKIAYAATEGEVAALKNAGKMVICSRLEWLPKGGTLAIVEEGGKPQIYLHMGNLATSGVTLSDAILKIGKKL